MIIIVRPVLVSDIRLSTVTISVPLKIKKKFYTHSFIAILIYCIYRFTVVRNELEWI